MDPTLTREVAARAATGAPEAWAAEWEAVWEAAAVDSEVKFTFAHLRRLRVSNLNALLSYQLIQFNVARSTWKTAFIR